LPTPSEINAEIDAQLPTNSVGEITASRLRTVLHDMTNGLGGLATFTGSGDPGLTRAQAIATTFTSPPQTLRTTGYATPGDQGGGLYVKVSSLPAAPLTNIGTFTTTDGSFYKLALEGMSVHVHCFGAVPNASPLVTVNESWQAFEDAKCWILSQGPSADLFGGITLQLGIGAYYLSKAFSVEGNIFHVNGMGTAQTVIHTPYGQDGFIVQHAWTSGVDGQTFGHEGDPYSLTGSKYLYQYMGRGTHIYKAVVAGTSSGSTPPTGTANGQHDGTVIWDYVRERSWAESRGKGSGGSRISNILFWNLWNPARNPEVQPSEDLTMDGGAFFTGVLLRARGSIEWCQAIGWPGHAFACAGDGDPELRGSGNANNWTVKHCQAYFNGHDAWHVGYSDANAGKIIDFDSAQNGRSMITDYSFLGNGYIFVQCAIDGAYWQGNPRHECQVIHNGYNWIARAWDVGGENSPDYINEEPGVAPTGGKADAWTRLFGDGTATPGGDWPAWSSTTKYQVAGAYVSYNINADNAVYRLYIEDGTRIGQPGPRDFIHLGAGIQSLDKTRGAGIQKGRTFFNPMAFQNTWIGNDGVVKQSTVTVGGLNKDSQQGRTPDTTLINFNAFDGSQSGFQIDGNGADNTVHSDIWFGNQGAGWSWGIMCGPNTTRTFGRSTAIPFATLFPRFVMGDTSGTGGRMHFIAGAAPTSGAHAQGERAYNYGAATSGDVTVWQCTASGTPGTWVAVEHLP
jgi:hypothetical protein